MMVASVTVPGLVLRLLLALVAPADGTHALKACPIVGLEVPARKRC
jgi:hypothetical protein